MMEITQIQKIERDFIIKEVLRLIKAWNGYGDDRFPEGELKELVKEIKKLKQTRTKQ